MSPGDPWTIFRPVLALTSDRSTTAAWRADAGPVDEWFAPAVLSANGLAAVSFDFFVDWSKGTLSPLLLAKVIASRVTDGGVVGAGLPALQAVLAEFQDWGRLLYRLCDGRGLVPSWAVIPDWIDWGVDEGAILLCAIDSDGLPAGVERLKLDAIRDLVATNTGQRFTPQKDLYWSTTSLEGHLSKTDTPWPGDADLVLVEAASGVPLAIVEFRKQTQDRELESRFTEYYPGKDSRRWDRLAILAAHFDSQPPLLAVHYSSRASERSVLVNRIEGLPGKLSEVSQLRLEVPVDQAAREAFTAEVIASL